MKGSWHSLDSELKHVVVLKGIMHSGVFLFPVNILNPNAINNLPCKILNPQVIGINFDFKKNPKRNKQPHPVCIHWLDFVFLDFKLGHTLKISNVFLFFLIWIHFSSLVCSSASFCTTNMVVCSYYSFLALQFSYLLLSYEQIFFAVHSEAS